MRTVFKCIKGLCAHQPLVECVWTDEISVRRYWCDVGLSITSSVYTIPCQGLMNIQLTLCQLLLNVLHVRVLYITLSCCFLFLLSCHPLSTTSFGCTPHPPLPFSPTSTYSILPLPSLLCRMSPCRTWPQCWPEQATWRMPQN